jgi:hypothetical protein
MLARLGFGFDLFLPCFGPCNQTVKFVTIGAIGTKCFLVEKTLDPATQTDLVGTTLGANRPAHFAVPAAAKQYHAGTGQPRRQEAKGPQPLRLLVAFTHYTEPITAYQC